MTAPAAVAAVAADSEHRFSKTVRPAIRLLAGLGVEGDAHCGRTVQNPWRIEHDPAAPNRTQVHLIPAELHDTLAAAGFPLAPGDLGENITTRGLDLQALPTGTLLRLGPDAAVELTGLRSPCAQIDRFRPGLLKQVLLRGAGGAIVRRAGVMAVVHRGGEVRAGMPVAVTEPAGERLPLGPV